MKREIRDKRHKLLLRSKALKEAKFNEKLQKGDEVSKLIKDQEEVYKKWAFFDGIIKADEKVRRG